MNRTDFMNFFRDDELLNSLSADDRLEIFYSVLVGSSDFTKEHFDKLFSDYCISHLTIMEIYGKQT